MWFYFDNDSARVANEQHMTHEYCAANKAYEDLV